MSAATVAPSSLTNGHAGTQDPMLPPAPAPVSQKKGKGKKEKIGADETSKLLAAKISQLEQDAAGEKDQEAEIEREVKKATRDLNQLLNNIESPLTRLDTVQKKYTELLADMKKLDRDYSKSKKRADQLQKDQDKSKSEYNKTATMKDKLEKLCRELTKENKKVKDENKRLDDTEKKARGLVNERLGTLLFDVQDMMNAKGGSQSENLNTELDELFKIRCKVLADQMDLRELHFKSMLRHKDAEIANLAAKHEVERKRADAEATRCRTLTAQVSTFSHTESELRSQLNIYVEKFKQVEDTLNNSNELFLTFRKEMEEMSKKTKRLEKENLTLTRKHDQTNRNILEMAEERTRDKDELEKLHKKETQMRSIIQSMREQGRGISHDVPPDVDDEATESDLEDGYEDDEEEDEEGSFEGDEELAAEFSKPVFGPVPPPTLSEARPNGSKINVNGIKH
ncbi:hypothetical protein EPUS_09231 [Endocarpon pusillum Z07020]|uniref:Alpha-taxilin n=1 Tax=Endocarpon pusillum (strain Z07020 / HMAS-L-300199) TaxID=1263415 RepID=U1HU62_ENDPU|nr:uncharacterized protein EPUS_09231 [Endocarpon pusillum Z07020]ERF74135.1 hypothetical protein EPUS_09231 [Endocarpon pusillum Z07020]